MYSFLCIAVFIEPMDSEFVCLKVAGHYPFYGGRKRINLFEGMISTLLLQFLYLKLQYD